MITQSATRLCFPADEYAKREVDRDEDGQGMIEYGLLVALISIAALAVIVLMGPQLMSIFGSVYNSL
jgi:pilus assembly protein Flp/PilA